MVMVSISETYDLSTVKDKMTLIGIHTPKKELIQKTYPGLCMNSKYFRIVKTDVILTAVSGTIAITPDMVGDNSVDGIAPEDVLNPILYKAVSNDSWSTLEARLMGLREQVLQSGFQAPAGVVGNMAFADNDDVTGLADEFKVYYSLLAHHEGFKPAPIQRGLQMRGLKPLVFEAWYDHGENRTYADNAKSAPSIVENTADNFVLQVAQARTMRGRPHVMPRINTTYLTGAKPSNLPDSGYQLNGMDAGTPVNRQIQMPDVPPVMLACIVMPPCRKTKLFFRMVVRTYISFEDVRPIQEITGFDDLDKVYGPLVYHSDYNTQSSRMDKTTDMVDVQNAEIDKIMEGR